MEHVSNRAVHVETARSLNSRVTATFTIFSLKKKRQKVWLQTFAERTKLTKEEQQQNKIFDAENCQSSTKCNVNPQ